MLWQGQLSYQRTGLSLSVPVVDTTLVYIGIATSLQKGCSIRQINVKVAFLNGEIDRPALFSHPSNLLKQNYFYKLKKALYGLRLAPLQWFQNGIWLLQKDRKERSNIEVLF